MGDAKQKLDQEESRSNLIVNYLPQTMTEKELYNMFITIGPVQSCRVMKNLKTGYSYGFGFVNYTKQEDAARAINTLNGLEIQNKRLKVSYARPSGDDIKDTNLYVTNLPRNINEGYLDQLFGKYGQIVQRNLLKDKLTGLPRGVAFVRFNLRDEAMEAISKLNGVTPENGTEPLQVKVAEEHGKAKAAYYAGWQAGYNQSRGGPGGPLGPGGPGPLTTMRGGGSGGLNVGGRGGQQGGVMRGGFNNSPRGIPTFTGTPFANGNAYTGVMRPDKSHNRYNPIGMGGGYSMYNWN